MAGIWAVRHDGDDATDQGSGGRRLVQVGMGAPKREWLAWGGKMWGSLEGWCRGTDGQAQKEALTAKGKPRKKKRKE